MSDACSRFSRCPIISKSFPGVKALEDVSMSLAAGEVLAVVGENGAGKSTLIKILSGVYSADTGEIRLQGRQRPPARPEGRHRARDQHDLPGDLPGTGHHRCGEHLPRPPAHRQGRAGSTGSA